MKSKKTAKANLNNYSSTFILIGLVVATFLFWKMIELKTYEKEVDIGKLNLQDSDEDQTLEVNVEKIKTPPPPPPVKAPEEIKVVEDEKDVKEDAIQSNETDENDEIQQVENIQPDEIEQPDVEVAFQFIQNPPVYPGCEGKTGKKLKDCMSNKIKQFIGKYFNREIASDLGLSGETIRISAQFIVDTSGKVTEIKARSKYKDLTNEAKRVLSKLPKMKPGQQRNRPVKVRYNLPIIFKVEEE